ncbi:MAG TPA: hypothetical protein VJZ94_03515, partial [Candidatus Paceibacterota bacterium]|nr:hypothetical protein [Candidatus Paceibacterota bacterium]
MPKKSPRESASWRTERRRSHSADNFKFFFGGIQSQNSQSEYLKNNEFLTMVSILEKSRAPSRIEFRKGLEWGDGDQFGTSRRLPAEEV